MRLPSRLPAPLAILALGPGSVIVILFISLPLRFAPSIWPQFYVDDFFYYLVIAQHLIGLGLSSFDGVTITNGYHPMWMLVVSGLLLLAGGGGKTLLLLLLAVQIGASLVAMWLVFCLLVRRGTRPLIVIAVLPLFALAMSDIAMTGMEVVIAVPMVLALVAEAARGDSACGIRFLRFGLLASACILARVDTVILVVLVLLAVAPSLRPLPGKTRDIARLAAGFLPAAFYFASNLAVFGTILPISSAAKALAPGLFFHGQSLLQPLIGSGFSAREKFVMIVPAWGVYAIALWGLARLRTSNLNERLLTSLCVFPPLFYLLLAVRSDWMLWNWYLYPVVTASPFAASALAEALYRLNARAAGPIVAVAGSILGAIPAVLDYSGHIGKAGPGRNGIFDAATALASFGATHPGTYAMGDRAGSVAFLINRPVFQLEGIVGDAQLLADIGHRVPLLNVLRKHHVTYYIGTAMPREGDCWVGIEPKPDQAGPLSPAMRSRFCRGPLFEMTDWLGVKTQVFAVGKEDLLF